MECPVCFTGLAEGSNVPKVLPCGHTFCSSCTQQLVNSSGGDGCIHCPQCRSECRESDISINFALRDLLQSSSQSRLRQPLLSSYSASQPPQALVLDVPSAPPAPAPPSIPEDVAPMPQAAQALAVPMQQSMRPMLATERPWAVGPQNIYAPPAMQQFALPDGAPPTAEEAEWKQRRRTMLLEWGKKREDFMHRKPRFLMDQMVSGSGLYPIRLLDNSWLLPSELRMVATLERMLEGTGNALHLARDMLTPLIYDIDVRIVLDNSGSMQLDMFGQPIRSSGNLSSGWIEQCSAQDNRLLRDLFKSMRQPKFGSAPMPPNSPLSPHHRRWLFARDAVSRWMDVYRVMGIDPYVYLLNNSHAGYKVRGSQLPAVFQSMPQGRTPMTETIQTALQDHQYEAPDKSLLLLVVTDGEADDMQSFNAILDSIQNDMYGDVQVCFMGLSLQPRDIEWFENEECDETRIRTVEAYEVEQRQIQLREVVSKEGAYNFEMHTYRVLLTNFFPADYDYEAPLQNLRHRLYITLHGRDRWYGLNSSCWRFCVSNLLCSACFLATGAHCCGWCQGNECGKCQFPELLEGFFKEED